MTLDATNVSYILSIAALFTIAFTIYNHFQNPQTALDKREALNDEKADGKASLLAQQLQWEKESNAAKFAELGLRITEAMSLAQNHIHTVDTKVDRLIESVGVMGNGVTELRTIINERIPKK